MSFALVLFEEDPVSSGIVHVRDVIGGPEEGSRRRVKWKRKTLWAKVILVGELKCSFRAMLALSCNVCVHYHILSIAGCHFRYVFRSYGLHSFQSC